ncbi:hypothetical protein CPB84DRAFT_1758947 [Gymnopilus junonius]|uniref:Uncharacterized protein n=1 Tax=Gymnopilus junonius TaxID=109634 RepID=A0A9P5TVD7_GYMJU|nr:hypothetical protein CPB84DRAFT_1758947 [Gymnopilus junonius]
MSILSPLYNLPNHVTEKQRAYQASTKPLIWRGPRQHIYLPAFFTLFAAGMASTVYAAFHLAKGKN